MMQDRNLESPNIRELVAREGKAARNLITWSVPVATKTGRRRRFRPSQKTGPRIPSRGSVNGLVAPQLVSPRGNDEVARSEAMCVAAAGQYSGGQRAVGSPEKKPDLHCRYWWYLFDNLHRAVDEIYYTCEEDESIVECEEVAMTLEGCRKDFEALIRRIKLQTAFENSDVQSRPPGLAWEVRTSPRKAKTQLELPSSMNTVAAKSLSVRNLDFRSKQNGVGVEPTWAERVKGVTRSKVPSQSNTEETKWETVTRDSKRTVPPRNHLPAMCREEGSDGRQSEEPGKVGRPLQQAEVGRKLQEQGEVGRQLQEQGKVGKKLQEQAEGGRQLQEQGEVGGKLQEQEEVGRKLQEQEEVGRQLQEQGEVGKKLQEQGETEKRPEEHENRNPEWNWSDIVAEYDAGEAYRKTMSWADRCESPPEGIPDVPRSPGRAIHLHQRLLSPSRKRPIEESKRILEERQAKAQQQRDRIQEEITHRSKMVAEKIREARESRDARTQQRREAMEGRLQRAEILRESHLQERIRKAQEEEAKVSEIAFINTLEAQNKKMEVMERYQGHEARLHDLQEERQRRREEQQAKEEAALERRRALEAERQAKLMEMDQKRREQDAKIEQMRQDRERAREEAAREKARERERKLEARNAAILSTAEELERKIQLKQDESSRRHDQQLEQRKEKAAISSRHTSSEDAPRVEAYLRSKWCSICTVKIISEVYLLSHLRGLRHQEALAALTSVPDPVIVEAPEEHLSTQRVEVEERIRAGRKRAKKLRHRMASRVHEECRSQSSPTVQSKHRARLQRAVRELNRQLDSPGAWEATHVDRALGEIGRLLGDKSPEDQVCFCQLGGLASLLRLMLMLTPDPTSSKPKKTPSEKSFGLAVSAVHASCVGHIDNCRHLVLSNKVGPMVDLLHALLPGEAGTALLALLAGVLSTLASTRPPPSFEQPLSDTISYLVCMGTIDQLCSCFTAITGPIEDPLTAQLLVSGLNLVVATTACLHHRITDVFAAKCDDPTMLIATLQQTELVGLMQLLYAMLLHDGPPRHSSSPLPLPHTTLTIATAAVKAINNCAILHLKTVQCCLGAEGISLEFRLVVSYLLWYCSHYEHFTLLHELILAVGYFCVLNTENQVFLQSGCSPTLLQLLCALPFEYFSNPKLSQLLFPSLIAACYHVEENMKTMQQEISPQLLVAFLQDQQKEGGGGIPQDRQKEGGPKVLDFAALCQRFPPSHWQKALEFFSK